MLRPQPCRSGCQAAAVEATCYLGITLPLRASAQAGKAYQEALRSVVDYRGQRWRSGGWQRHCALDQAIEVGLEHGSGLRESAKQPSCTNSKGGLRSWNFGSGNEA
ncbi:hypothetical protein [Methylobacterium nonmethylotrophicum]|uniref:hypothetical protein n=1 Tax=Methylobacterium nonmethylotrophicum TaxID=1141884 RepID=UPI00143686D2|nr:hypothetical protein [Methylobacterium nonmethylotrophicum]